MSLPSSVTCYQLRNVYSISGNCLATEIFTSVMPRSFWEPVLVWSASQFQEESALFFLAATRYRQAPTKQKMNYIYRHFVGHGRTLAVRGLNIGSDARERTFELVTGAQTQHYHGGCRIDAFDHATTSLAGYLNHDINQRFGDALRKDPETKFTMLAAQNMEIQQELTDMSRLGLNL